MVYQIKNFLIEYDTHLAKSLKEKRSPDQQERIDSIIQIIANRLITDKYSRYVVQALKSTEERLYLRSLLARLTINIRKGSTDPHKIEKVLNKIAELRRVALKSNLNIKAKFRRTIASGDTTMPLLSRHKSSSNQVEQDSTINHAAILERHTPKTI